MKTSLIGAGLIALSCTFGFCQAPSAPATDHPATINQRKENQQDRIAQGVKSGQLTAGETSRLEGREASINHQERSMRAADNGHVTRADRATLNRRQNRTSRAIYRDKHNSKKQ